MTELETLQRAKMYIDKLANGKNPLDDTTLSENDIVNNVRISRCLFYVSGILGKVIENDGVVQNKRVKKTDFTISQEELEYFDYSNKPIPVSEIAKRVNTVSKSENSKTFTHRMVTDWLMELGMLCEIQNAEGKKSKRPTEEGTALGISLEERIGERGIYHIVVYNLAAQSFIIDNIFSIIEHHNQKNSRENQGLTWDEQQDHQLLEMYKNNMSIRVIAETMKRSNGGIRARLKRLGFEV